MLSFDAQSIPSPLVIREYTRPRFDTDLDALKDWLAELKTRGVRQAGPALVLTLENLRKTELSSNRRLTILSLLKVPVLKTCAGLPKPSAHDATATDANHGLTMEQRLGRLMFVNLNRTLHQLDKEHPVPNARQQQSRLWLTRNLFRFAGRQIRYAALWKTTLPTGTWRDLHELHLYLSSRRLNSFWDLDAQRPTIGEFDHEIEYRTLLLLGLAAKLKDSVLQNTYFMEGLPAWAAQTRLEDPHTKLGRLRLLVVEASSDEAPRQLTGSLEIPFRGWVLQPPYPYLHELENGPFGMSAFGDQPLGLEAY
ncbi:hypothetical protein [Allochromatium palmeri]|uniref:Uncharacterized protein n=1 Tax=Allochromatium palmeri TaxID=231048 RepID=A0A6N8ECZ4_9GAMM|nr:hypothetical protein [Allochromatium palmeri]MTW21441.1 hypothetical protein [Allochromatium palmeri]